MSLLHDAQLEAATSVGGGTLGEQAQISSKAFQKCAVCHSAAAAAAASAAASLRLAAVTAAAAAAANAAASCLLQL
eukprot:1147540-Pelagomonas_calceolata.AAC.5